MISGFSVERDPAPASYWQVRFPSGLSVWHELARMARVARISKDSPIQQKTAQSGTRPHELARVARMARVAFEHTNCRSAQIRAPRPGIRSFVPTRSSSARSRRSRRVRRCRPDAARGVVSIVVHADESTTRTSFVLSSGKRGYFPFAIK